MSITLTLEEYEALATLARDGASTVERKRAVEDYIRFIDKKNGIVRRTLWVQWQETDSPLPPTTRFPDVWPPELRAKIERTDRDIAKIDVTNLLAERASRPITVLVTPDPAGQLGWTKIEDYFRNP